MYIGSEMEKQTDRDRAKCKSCKTIFDLPTLRENPDYEPGICIKCGGILWESK